MRVVFKDKMGSDLSVVNAARVSFSKESMGSPAGFLDADKRLINFLAKHNHWTPFGHCSLQVHVTAPIFVARQLAKHQVGLVWNEESRRYIDHPPEVFEPSAWRARAESAKQGSNEEIEINTMVANEFGARNRIDDVVNNANARMLALYQELLDSGVCPEQARMVLPQSTYVQWYWSGTLMAFARICGLRCKPDTQLETRIIANQISEIAAEHFPHSWDALNTWS